MAVTFAEANLIKEDTATKTLVVVDDWSTVETHSVFFDHIRSALGHKIEFAMSETGPSGKVKHHDAYYFDNIVMMSPSVKGKCPPTKLSLLFLTLVLLPCFNRK